MKNEKETKQNKKSLKTFFFGATKNKQVKCANTYTNIPTEQTYKQQTKCVH